MLWLICGLEGHPALLLLYLGQELHGRAWSSEAIVRVGMGGGGESGGQLGAAVHSGGGQDPGGEVAQRMQQCTQRHEGNVTGGRVRGAGPGHVHQAQPAAV